MTSHEQAARLHKAGILASRCAVMGIDADTLDTWDEVNWDDFSQVCGVDFPSPRTRELVKSILRPPAPEADPFKGLPT